MIFKPMKREVILQALEGQQNVLKPAVEEHERFFKRISCPSCGGEVTAVVNAKQPFKEGEILPNFLARCRVCSMEFEPTTGIIVKLAD